MPGAWARAGPSPGLLYSFGLKSRREGIVHVFRPVKGRADYVCMLKPDDWQALAGIARSD